MSGLSTLLFRLLKLASTFFNLLKSKISTPGFKLVKSVFLTKSDVSSPVTFLNLLLLHNLINLIQLSLFLQKISVFENIHSLTLHVFYQSNY